MRAKKGQPAAFVSAALVSNSDACIEWPFGTSGTGYGSIRVGGKTRHAHTEACERAHGMAPLGRGEAAHSCGNRKCINPRHLRWASSHENHIDMKEHGTSLWGTKNPSCKLTPADVLAIRNKSGTLEQIASEYGVSWSLVGKIKRGKLWARL